MKIDKVIFSSSEEYSCWWNVQSKVWKTFLNIDPVLLLYGSKKKHNLSEEYGQIIECKYEEPPTSSIFGDLRSFNMRQLIFNKWYYTQNEPETTWLVGDIDLLPLQKNHFIKNISEIPDDYHVHLCSNRLPRRLTGHYHVAKGKTFSAILELQRSLVEHSFAQLAGAQELTKTDWESLNTQPAHGGSVWTYEEYYTTDLIKKNIPSLNASSMESHHWFNHFDKFTGFIAPQYRKLQPKARLHEELKEDFLKKYGFDDKTILPHSFPYEEQLRNEDSRQHKELLTLNLTESELESGIRNLSNKNLDLNLLKNGYYIDMHCHHPKNCHMIDDRVWPILNAAFNDKP